MELGDELLEEWKVVVADVVEVDARRGRDGERRGVAGGGLEGYEPRVGLLGAQTDAQESKQLRPEISVLHVSRYRSEAEA